MANPQQTPKSEKKLTVNQETCISCGTCIALCGEVFAFNYKGKSYVKDEKATCKTCEIQQIIESCPVAAISWKEA